MDTIYRLTAYEKEDVNNSKVLYNICHHTMFPDYIHLLLTKQYIDGNPKKGKVLSVHKDYYLFLTINRIKLI